MMYTKCADPACPEPLLLTSYVGQETHPGCAPTKAELQAREFIDAIQRGDDAEAQRLERELDKPTPIASLGSSALWYASIGWPVFPLLTPAQAERVARREGIAVEKAAKRPATKNGLNDATVDADRIRSLWTKEPGYGIGLATGHAFDVIDIDGEAGYRSLRDLDPEIFPPVHGKVSTTRPDGGEHWYVLPTGDGNRAHVTPGIDYRGRGGYVCAPPTEIGGQR